MEPNQFYHIYNRANAFENLFHSPENYRFFLEKCNRYLPEIATLYAFALIPNHFHLLIHTHSQDQIKLDRLEFQTRASQVFSNFFNSYTKSFNKYYKRRGTLFSRHFKNELIDTLEYRKNCVLYLHHNAIHHKMCSDLGEWSYTSHGLLIDNPQDDSNARVLSWFGGLTGYAMACEKYKRRLDEGIVGLHTSLE